jgi:hypothetical protein
MTLDEALEQHRQTLRFAALKHGGGVSGPRVTEGIVFLPDSVLTKTKSPHQVYLLKKRWSTSFCV